MKEVWRVAAAALNASGVPRGYSLYRVCGPELGICFTYARTSDQALANVARFYGESAEKYIVGTTYEGSTDGI